MNIHVLALEFLTEEEYTEFENTFDKLVSLYEKHKEGEDNQDEILEAALHLCYLWCDA